MQSSDTVTLGARDLVRENLPLARQIAGRLKKRYSWVPLEDLHSYSLLGLTLAAKAFDRTRGVPFPNYASQKALFWAIDEMRKDGVLVRRSSAANRPKTVRFGDSRMQEDTPAMQVPDRAADRTARRVEVRDFVKTMLGKLSEEERRLMELYYADEMTFGEIARVFDLSESSICLRHKAIIKKLRLMARRGRQPA